MNFLGTPQLCAGVDVSFFFKVSFLKHPTVHFKEKPHFCNEPGCDKKFALKGNLKRHIRIVHLKEKPHFCNEPGCDKKFALKGNLKQHISGVHSKEKPHACIEPSCGKKFGRKRTLTQHIRGGIN